MYPFIYLLDMYILHIIKILINYNILSLTMVKFLIGPAGLGSPAEEGIKNLKKKGLDCAEIAFTYQVYMSNSKAKIVGQLAKKLGIKLTVHAPYYINLNSKDKKKIEQSKKRILNSCERAHYLGAKHVTFHPGYYGKDDPETTYKNIKKAILEMQKIIKKNKWNVKLSPETTGKSNVFGSRKEILRLVRETHCSFTLDFAHVKARNQGKITYSEILSSFKKFKNIHAHFSGIEWSAKGERYHKSTPTEEIKKLISAIKKSHVKQIMIINESPTNITDSIKTKELIK